jgi:hypothetical protein
MILRRASLLPRDRMSIIETDQPLAVRSVQRERIVDTVRLFRRHWHPRYDKPDPMAALWVHHENLTVEVEKHIEGRVTRLCHGI